MKNRTINAIIATSMALSMLTACGNSGNTDVQNNTNESAPTELSSVQTEATTSETEATEDLSLQARKDITNSFSDLCDLAGVAYDKDNDVYNITLKFIESDHFKSCNIDIWRKFYDEIMLQYDETKKYLVNADFSGKCTLQASGNNGDIVLAIDEAGNVIFNIREEDEKFYQANTIEIGSAAFAKDYKGNRAVIVEFTFNNNCFDKSRSFVTTFNAQAFQNGVELETAIFADSDVLNANEQLLDVQPGGSLTVHKGFLIRDDSADVNIIVSEYFGDKIYATKDFHM